jgi:hypothetical protein
LDKVAAGAVGMIEVHNMVCEGLVGKGVQGSVFVMVLTVMFMAVDPMDEGVLERDVDTLSWYKVIEAVC